MPPSNLQPPNRPFLKGSLNSDLNRGTISQRTTRRRFLQTSLAATSTVLLSNCARNLGSSGGASPSASPAANPTDPKKLYIYSWTNYSNPALLKKFEQETGIQAIVDIYDSNETMLTKLQAGGGSAYSLIYPTDYAVAQMISDGMLTELDQARIKGLNGLKPKWKNPIYDAKNAHSIPIAWGTSGLIYNTKRLDAEIKGWDYLWDNISSLRGKVTLLNDVRETMGATLLYLGYSINATDRQQIEAAYDKLMELKPALAGFKTNGWEEPIVSGDLAVSMVYSTDAFAVIPEKPELDYIIPDTGASVWTDTMVVPKSAPNPDAAYEWINFLLKPENSAFMAEKQGFATPLEPAYKLLPTKLQENRKLFPTDAELEKCEGIAPLKSETLEVYENFWTKLTST
jgi:spermidine/putrescine transport system substrate-binding protein